MCSAQVSQPDNAVGLTDAPRWRVVSVKALPAHRLEVTFHDGTRGNVDLRDLIHATDAGVFASLRDETIFNQVGVAHGAPSWPGEIDLAPDALYRAVINHSPFPVSG